jgi:hypothetical protein
MWYIFIIKKKYVVYIIDQIYQLFNKFLFIIAPKGVISI